MSECWDPRCQIPEHRHTMDGLGADLTETERLALRNTLLANRDMGLTAAEATAVAYVAKPAIEAILTARVASAAAENAVLRSRLDEVRAALLQGGQNAEIRWRAALVALDAPVLAPAHDEGSGVCTTCAWGQTRCLTHNPWISAEPSNERSE